MRCTPFVAGAILTALVSGCTTLPVAGPSQRHVEKLAVESIAFDRRAVVQDYVLLDLSPLVLNNVVDVGPDSLFATFGMGKGRPPEMRIGPGDVVSVSIFESSAGGLFQPGDVNNRPGSFVTLPPQTVDYRGNISVPYAGEIRAGGASVRDLQRRIETKLASRAIEPQVVIAMQEQNAAEVAVFGDATGGMKSRIKPGGERVLDVIAKAGLKIPGYETFVTLQRRGRQATVFLPQLIRNPSENVFVEPGDVIYAYRDPQRFVAVGALGNTSQTTGLTGQLLFDSERLSLAEAVAKAGGLLDSRASPSHVFLYRLEPRRVLERMGLALAAFPADQKLIPTIYRANYRDPSVFFFAEQFSMRHKDIIYVANADAVEVDKFLSFVRLLTSSVAGVTTDVALTKQAIRVIGD